MKRLFRIITVALAAGLSIISCGEKPVNGEVPVVNPGGDETDPKDGPRVITVSFNTRATRTALDEESLTPSFVENDVITVTDGNGTKEECKVYFEDSYARIKITNAALKDIEVIAVYPKSAYIDSAPYFQVPAVQDGTFPGANICKTTIAAGATAAVFKNQTALLIINVPNETPHLTVSSLGKIDGTTGQRGSTSSSITSTGTTIEIPGNNATCPATCYVAVMADAEDPVLLSDLCVDTGEYMGGFSPNLLKEKNLSLNYTVKANDIYHFNYFHPYVEIGGMKWSTVNIGADSPEDYGEYFTWGATKGYMATEDSPNWRFSDNSCHFDSDHYTITPDFYNNILKLQNDAAYYNWGGAWRMPTSDELDALSDYYSESAEDGDVGSGYIFNDGEIKLFFPAAGYGDHEELWLNGDWGMVSRHWSSTGSDTNSYCLRIESIQFDDPDYPYVPSDPKYYDPYLFHSISNNIKQYYGLPIRPIYVGGTGGGDTNITGGSLNPYGKDTETF